MQIYELKINNFILSLNSVLTVLPEYFLATSILSMAIFFSISQKMQIQTKSVKINFFSLGMIQLNYLAVLIIFFYCFLCIKQNFLFLSDFVNFNNTIHNDFISVLSKLIIGISSIIYLLFIQQYLTDQKLNNFEYYIIILTAILGLCLLCCSDDLLTAYLAIELQGLSFYILASFKKTSNYSVESGVKYFILGSFSTVIFLLGITLIYSVSGSLSMIDFKDLFSWTFSSDSYFLKKDFQDSSILKSLISFYATSLILDEYSTYNYYFIKDDLTYDMISIFPEITSALDFIEPNDENFYYYMVFGMLEIKLFITDRKLSLKKLIINMDSEDYSALMDAYMYSADPKFITLTYGIKNEKFNFLEKESPSLVGNSLLELGLLIILISLFFKLALSPFHLWSPDIYEGSPSSTTFFFTIITKLSIFIFLLRFCYISFYSSIIDWQMYLLIIALLSIIVGSIGGLKQRKLKSLLAYSSISNMGLILVSLSSGNFEGVKAIFYYFIIYIISGLAIWSIVLILRLKRKNSFEKHNKDLGDFSLLKESNVILAYAAVITLFTIAGIPPTVGFLAKINIFLSLTTASLYFVALISILATVISTFYYIRILKIIFFESVLVGKLFHPINSKNIIVCNLLFFLLLFLFISPGFISLLSYKTTLFLNKTFY